MQAERSGRKQWTTLNREIAQCVRCPRLIKHCRKVALEKRKAYVSQDYWGRPVPNFGAAGAQLLIVGLAPAAHGANRTGRMFTGDRSGEWLYRALHKAGFANQARSESIDDGLELINCVITAVAHCAPPENKPTFREIENCRPFLERTFAVLPVRVVLALGGIAWEAAIDYALSKAWWQGKRPKFGHGAHVEFKNGIKLIGSYHPSQQNTFTKRLTEPMFDQVFTQVRTELADGRRT